MSWLRLTTGFALCVALALAGCSEPGTAPPEQAAASPEVAALQFSQAKATGNSYMLVAGKWKAAQTEAVEAAGGEVIFSHKATGIGTVRSDAPDFLERVLDSGAFSDGFADEVVEWQKPDDAVEFESTVVTPGDETFYSYQWNMQAIEAPAAWASGATGAGARVAVIDGGLYDVHPDIEPNLDAACSASFYPPYPFNYDVGTFWHGTHVAGIVLAADNGFGVIGVAPEATLMHVKALHGGSGPFSSIINGILFASSPASFSGYEGCERADVINMSLGAIFQKRALPGFISVITKAVNYAASKGVLVISSAGNNGLDLGQLFDVVTVPAQAGSGLAVSATGPVFGVDYRQLAPYSNYGEDLVFVAAPGGNPAGSVFDWVLSSCRGSSAPPTFSFCFAYGTSMAAPAAAGVAALIVGNNPGISLGKLKSMLKNSADDEGKRGKDQFYGHGFVNAYNAVH